MKKIILIFFIFTNILFSQTLLDLTKDEKEFIKSHPIINVGVEKDWPPFDFYENNQYKGVAKDYLKKIEELSGLKFKFIPDSWNNPLEKTKKKQIDLLPILAKDKEREKFLLYTNSYLKIRDYIFTNNSIKINSLHDLYGKTIAIPKGFAQELFLKENHPKIKLLLVNNVLEAIDAIITKKADATISNTAMMNYLLNRYNISGIEAQKGFNFSGNVLHMATRKDFALLRNIIQKSLDNISEKDKNKISEKWINLKDQIDQTFPLSKEEKNYIKNKQRVYISYEKELMPFIFDNDNIKDGYVIDYMKYLSNKIGLEPIFVSKKYKTAKEMLFNGDIDIISDMIYSKDSNSSFALSKPYLEQSFSIINKKAFQFNSINSLKNKKIGLLKDDYLANYIRKEYSDSIRILEFDSLEDIFEALKANYIDATILNNLIANHYINKFYSNELTISNQIDIDNFDSNLRIATKKENQILLNLYERAINLTSQKELDKLYTKWVNSTKNLKLTTTELNFIKTHTIKVAYTDNWAPLSYNENDTPKGLGFDFWELIAKKSGIKYKTELKRNFGEALNSIKNKTDDIIITTSKTKDREKYAIFSDVYFKAPIGIATIQDKDYIPNIESIINKKIGVGKNHTAHKLLKEKYPNLNFVFIENSVDGLNKLSNNKIFALVDIMPVLAHNIEKFGYSNIKISGSTGVNINLEIMIRDDYETLKSIINKTLLNLELKEKNQIYNKWSKLNYKEPFDYSIVWKPLIPFMIIIIIILYKNRQLLRYQKSLNQTKNELENSLESFKTLVDLTIEGIVIIQNNKIIFTNSEMIKIFNLTKEKLLSTNIEKLFEKENDIDISTILKKSDSQTFEINGLRELTKAFPCMIKAKDIVFDNKNSTILSIIDMSEIKEKESLLINQSKMASLGEMIGNIAHQWRQPLSIISTSSTGLKLQKEYGGEIDENTLISTLDNITNTTKFLSQTIDDFQDYLKKDKEKSSFDFNSNLENVLNILNASFEIHEIRLIQNIENGLTIFAYPNELKQVILNIINNSKDALKEITTTPRYIQINAFSKDENKVIEIIDNSGGIEENILNRVFEPYFTTKHQKQGTGLGLYMTHKIITQSINGNIKIENCSYNFENKLYEKCTKTIIEIPNL